MANENEVEVAIVLAHDCYWQICQHCLAIYRLQSEVS